MEKVKEHQHDYYIDRVYECNNFGLAVALVKCGLEDCDYSSLDGVSIFDFVY